MMRPLAVVGNVNVDLVLGPAAPWPRPGTEVMVESDELRVGGAAGNTALAWAALGVGFEIAGHVGADQFGLWLKAAFGPRAAAWREKPTGTTLSVGITHPDGERTFFTTLGHLPHFDLDDVFACLDGNRLEGGLLLVCGSFLTTGLAARYHILFDWAARHRIDIALDTGWPLAGWTPAVLTQTRGWLRHCRHLLLNEAETIALAGVDGAEEAAARLKPLLPADATIVVKRGPAGAFALGPGGETARVSGRPVAVVDTIGAGDVFNAGYLASLAAGRPLDEAVGMGIAVASCAISSKPRRYDRVVAGALGDPA